MVLKVAGVVVLWTVLSLAGMFALVFAGLHLTSQGTAGAARALACAPCDRVRRRVLLARVPPARSCPIEDRGSESIQGNARVMRANLWDGTPHVSS
jgi:hypothetical protein